MYRSSLLQAALRAFPENRLRLYQTNILSIWFLLFILLVIFIICNVLILRLLMQTVNVDVVCVVTFIVETSYFFFTFLLLGKWISGIPYTSFCSVAIPLIFSFSIIVGGFFRCLISWFCQSNPFTVTTIWKDTGILEEIIYFNLLFLLVGLFSRWWYFPFVFRRTSFSL